MQPKPNKIEVGNRTVREGFPKVNLTTLQGSQLNVISTPEHTQRQRKQMSVAVQENVSTSTKHNIVQTLVSVASQEGAELLDISDDQHLESFDKNEIEIPEEVH